MAYEKVQWSPITPITDENLDQGEGQYEAAKIDLDAHELKTTAIHGIEAGKRIAKTASESGYPKWAEIEEKPTETSIETRTDDPEMPEIGRIWLRTDI